MGIIRQQRQRFRFTGVTYLRRTEYAFHDRIFERRSVTLSFLCHELRFEQLHYVHLCGFPARHAQFTSIMNLEVSSTAKSLVTYERGRSPQI